MYILNLLQLEYDKQQKNRPINIAWQIWKWDLVNKYILKPENVYEEKIFDYIDSSNLFV